MLVECNAGVGAAMYCIGSGIAASRLVKGPCQIETMNLSNIGLKESNFYTWDPDIYIMCDEFCRLELEYS